MSHATTAHAGALAASDVLIAVWAVQRIHDAVALPVEERLAYLRNVRRNLAALEDQLAGMDERRLARPLA